VLQLASQLYEKECAEVSRVEQHRELETAAAEMGLPAEYVRQAALTIREQRLVHDRQSRRQRRVLATMGLAFALWAGWETTHHTVPGHVAVKVRRQVIAIVGSDLPGRDLSYLRLAGVNLGGANLRRANLSHSDLHSALLCAHLEGADLRGANLEGAVLCGAELRGANLEGAKLAGAVYDHRTQWPGGFDPATRGAVVMAHW
jgi:hypothetical protein